MFGCLYQKSGGHSCKDSYLGLLFCSISLQICFYTSTILFLLLLLCSIVWSRILWYFNLWSICLVYLSIHSLLCWQMKCRVDFSISVMNAIGILIGDCTEHAIGNIAIFIILILTIYENRRSSQVSRLWFLSSMIYCFHCKRSCSLPLLSWVLYLVFLRLQEIELFLDILRCIIYLILFASILLRIFASNFIKGNGL
jgi:hypothetical protein